MFPSSFHSILARFRLVPTPTPTKSLSPNPRLSLNLSSARLRPLDPAPQGNIANIPDHYLFRPLGPNVAEDDVEKLEKTIREAKGVLSAERQYKRERNFEKREEL